MSASRPGRPSSWGPTLAIIGGLGLVAAGLLVVPALLAPNEAATPSAVSPPASPARSVEASPYRSVSWAVVPFGDKAVELDMLLADDGRLIATGQADGETGFWYSDTGGHQWIRSGVGGRDPPHVDARAAVTALTGSRLGLLATGEWVGADGGSLGALLMVSADGRHWEILPVQPELAASRITALLGANDGYLAYAVDTLTNIAGWWQSADGLNWSTAPVTGLPTRVPPFAFAAGEHEVVAVGRRPAPGETAPDAWVSEDGFAWTSTLEDTASFGYAESVSRGEAGYAAAGSTWASGGRPEQGLATLWRSPDGRSWEALTMSQEAGTSTGDLAMTDAGVVGVLYQVAGSQMHAAFVAHGSDKPTSVPLPLRAVATVPLADGFVMLGRCPVGVDCPSATYLLLGTPTEDARAPAPTIPPG